MTQTPQDNRVIRITAQDAQDPHVDDLLRRQASLRGETGISRDRKSKWYLQNWFIFGIAGLLGAVGAWAILEPLFDDTFYIQGTLTSVDRDGAAAAEHAMGHREFELRVPIAGALKVGAQEVYLIEKTRTWSGGKEGDLDISALKPGQPIGVYISSEAAEMRLPLVAFVDPNPPATVPEKATYPLHRLLRRHQTAAILFFAIVAACVGLFIGAADGIVCRVFRRVLLAGAVGLAVGFIGGFVSGWLGNLAYTPLRTIAERNSNDTGYTAFGLMVQMGGRGLAWMLAGMTAGLGQGIVLRSGRLLLYGLLGGIIGGVLGGLLFDPIALLIKVDPTSAHWSRLVGLAAIGAATGAMIGVVELLARDAWLKMVEGPLAGKEFLIFKDSMTLGGSPRCEIYLFNDDLVEQRHATIRTVGDNYELESLDRNRLACVNGRPTQRIRLRHGDNISVGRTVFIFQKRRG